MTKHLASLARTAARVRDVQPGFPLATAHVEMSLLDFLPPELIQRGIDLLQRETPAERAMRARRAGAQLFDCCCSSSGAREGKNPDGGRRARAAPSSKARKTNVGWPQGTRTLYRPAGAREQASDFEGLNSDTLQASWRSGAGVRL